MASDATAAPADTGLIAGYLRALGGRAPAPGALAYYASLDTIAAGSPQIAAAIVSELRDQRSNLKLIASENYSSLATQLAQGNLFTDKYAEGYPGHRFYAGCDNVDAVESEAATLARELFGADHAYVQPHSGADANLVAFLAILGVRVEAPGLEAARETDLLKLPREGWEELRGRLLNQRLMAMDLYSGGHLTHGYRHNVSSRLFDVHPYATDPATQLIDLDAVRAQARAVRPLILLAGYSGYPRRIDFAAMREIADEVGAVLMVDMAHFAGLVAGRVFTGDFDPVPHAQVVTTTTHKTLRGPRGGMVLCDREFAQAVDRGCPAILGGPLPHVMAAKAVALREALDPGFRAYAARIVENAQVLAAALLEGGVKLVTGGTDNHMVILDVGGTYGLTGRQSESALREAGVTVNRNTVPQDPMGPWYTSGLRVGTPAVTTLGMGEAEMREIAAIIRHVLSHTAPGTIESGPRQGERSRARYIVDHGAIGTARGRVADLLRRHPLYPEIDLDLLLAAPFARAGKL